MIIGNGMISNIFYPYEAVNDVIIFASGVSNSNEQDKTKFLKEKELLLECLKKYKIKKFIYFSSCSINDAQLQNTPYRLHKKELETIIQNYSQNYLLLRLPNIIGSRRNENTLVDFFINKIKKNESFSVWKNATRNIVDIDDLYKIVSYIIDNHLFKNSVINIAYERNINMISLINALEIVLGKKAKYYTEDKGTDMEIDIEMIKPIMNKLNIMQPETLTLIKKYKSI